ncbi:MAG: hypothetical protein GVY28_05065 [Alphaproteobacteria bacterium]|jgi:hypothetical protein|nr:hypothetical protein [Alphaproteobacteria bacterium]
MRACVPDLTLSTDNPDRDAIVGAVDDAADGPGRPGVAQVVSPGSHRFPAALFVERRAADHPGGHRRAPGVG